MIKRVVGIHFSPLGGTKDMTEKLAEDIAARLRSGSTCDIKTEYFDVRGAEMLPAFDDETVAVIGVPSHVGKVPLQAMRMMKGMSGGNALLLAVVSYGGRSYGNSLYELTHFAKELGFKVIGAGAFAISYMAARGSARSAAPIMDIDSMAEFGKAAADKIMRLGGCEIEGLKIKPAPLEVRGKLPMHKISRISPQAAAVAQRVFDHVSVGRRESEWFL